MLCLNKMIETKRIHVPTRNVLIVETHCFVMICSCIQLYLCRVIKVPLRTYKCRLHACQLVFCLIYLHHDIEDGATKCRFLQVVDFFLSSIGYCSPCIYLAEKGVLTFFPLDQKKKHCIRRKSSK